MTKSIQVFYDRSERLWTVRADDGCGDPTYIYEPSRDMALLAAGQMADRLSLPTSRVEVS